MTSNSVRIAAIIAGVIVLFFLGFIIGYFASSRSSDSSSCKNTAEKRRAEQEKQLDFHAKLYAALDAEEIGKTLKYFSLRPHVGGTPRSKELADEIQKRWRDYGFDKVEQPKYNILLPYVSPNVSNKVQVLSETKTVLLEFSGKEKVADPSENDKTMIPPLLGYAKPGAANGTLLYVNYGRTEDFKVLRNNLGVPNCNGKIVIMRYGEYYRGDQVKNAELCGAVGAILYNDPADYARDGTDKVYPDYVWLPKTGVQRGSILKVRGDPLTPGLPSIDGVYRIPQEKATLPKIPATPLSYGDAENILKLMEGDDVPVSWKGKLPITYKLGNGGLKDNKTIKVEVNVPNTRQDIYNVIGTIYGKEEPDRWVLIGNHRDAWGFGAVDASSGTAAMMEVSRGLKDLLKSGWRPRRTIKFCSWGAEESGIIGSTEWVEENERALSTKGVTYINVDIAVAGNNTMFLTGSPLLKTMAFKQTKNVEDPHVNGGKKQTMYERMLQVSGHKKAPDYYNLGSGSDFATFYHFAGVPSLDILYGGDFGVLYPVYHTAYDTYKWLQGLIDPDFEYHLTSTRLASRLLMNAADTFVLPLDVSQYGISLNKSLTGLRSEYGAEFEQFNVSLNGIEGAILEYTKAAEKFIKENESAMNVKSDIELRDFNDRMVNVEKAFIYPYGLPNQPYTRHLVFAPSITNSYASTSFPGISDLMVATNKTEDNWQEIKRQISILFKAISEATAALLPDAKP